MFFFSRSVHNELEKHRYEHIRVLTSISASVFRLITPSLKWVKGKCIFLISVCRRAQLRHCLEQLKQQVPLSSDSTRNTTLNLLRRAQMHIKVRRHHERLRNLSWVIKLIDTVVFECEPGKKFSFYIFMPIIKL